METVRIDPKQYPRKAGESWYVAHPNARCEFRVPDEACTGCLIDFFDCKAGKIYDVVRGSRQGWVGVQSKETFYIMPEYVFARYFDAEAFIVGPKPTLEELERAKPFDYRPTVPLKQVEEFKDNCQCNGTCAAKDCACKD